MKYKLVFVEQQITFAAKDTYRVKTILAPTYAPVEEQSNG